MVYNLDVPASRYRPSLRAMPERLPQVEYDDHEIVRAVGTTRSYISFNGRRWKVLQAFCGECLAIRPLTVDGRFGVFFGAHQIASIDLTQPESVGDVPKQLSVISQG